MKNAPSPLRMAALLTLATLIAGCATAPPAPEAAPTPTTPPVIAPAPVALPAPPPPAPVVDETATPPPEVGPRARLDPQDDALRGDLWLRVRSGFAMPELDNELVRKWEQYYAQRPDYVQRMTARGARYLFHIVEEIDRRGMPADLALLPFIESAFNPQAMSSARASGMWQFMPLTGKDYDLKQNIFRDDRRDVLASTRAALDYLGRLNKMFNGDWQLSLAAYNWGEGNVKRAIARNERLGLPTDYESLSMPAETRHYVPKFQAVKNIVLAPQEFGLELPPLQNHPYFLSVPIRRDVDVAVAARLAGMSVDEFKTLNPQMNKPVILAAGTPQILLPYDNADTFMKRLASYQGALATWTAWVVPKTMKTAEAAQQTGMSEAALREINRIPPKMLVKAGSTLLVQRAETRVADVPEHVADNAHMALAPDIPPLKKIGLQARRGDTLAALAKRHGVTVAQMAQWNRLDADTRFRKPQALIAWVPLKAAPVAVAARDRSDRAERAMSKRELALAAKADRKAGKQRVAVAAATPRGGAARDVKLRPTRLARK